MSISMRAKKDTQIHFVGIGGIGMSGIAEVFLNQGYQVSGSDLQESDTTRRLAQLGARIAYGHKKENIQGAHVVVISSAVKPSNPEVQEAKRLRVPVIPRAEMLGELMRGKTGIAVAGTHGKTTTTSMLATILTMAGLDPTLVIGGKVDSLGGNAKLGQGQYVVAEADESDGSFLYLPATYGIVTNIDNDHLDHFGSLEKVEDAFVHFVGKLPFYGLVALCGEDPGVQRCMDRWTKPFVTYGLSNKCDFYATSVEARSPGSHFEVFGRSLATESHKKLGVVQIQVPGRHNVLNALGAITISIQLGIPFEKIAQALSEFGGVRRRFDVRWRDEKRKRLIVDDYGHHPTEIAATISAAKSFWTGRIVTVFQPHRYSRTQHCKEGFLSAFQDSDVVLITDIYAAGEEPIDGVDAQSLVDAIRKKGKEVIYVGDLERAKREALSRFKDGDLVICLGAGSITRLAEMLISEVQPGKA